jgi:hypothetical protein
MFDGSTISKKYISANTQDLSQRTMLASWLLEFYLSKCNELDDVIAAESASQDVDNLKAERVLVEDDLKHFLETYKVFSTWRFIRNCLTNCISQTNLPKEMTYDLIQGHGRSHIYLFYAAAIGDHERVVEHWILEEDWVKAIDVISRQVKRTTILSLLI